MSTILVRDPRCPYCGRPVLGTFVQGAEGRYHLACVEPPISHPLPHFLPNVPLVEILPYRVEAVNLEPCL